MATKPASGKAASKGASGKTGSDEIRVVATNRRAFHDYFVVEQLECGVVLQGTEVKSLRNAHVELTGAYARVDEKEDTVWLISANIKEYANAGPFYQHEPQRRRKLLLHKREVKRLRIALHDKGTTLIPLKIYFKGSRVKVQIGLCKAKKLYDKRDTKKQADIKRDLARYTKK